MLTKAANTARKRQLAWQDAKIKAAKAGLVIAVCASSDCRRFGVLMARSGKELPAGIPALSRCGACKETAYCSKECQVLPVYDWNCSSGSILVNFDINPNPSTQRIDWPAHKGQCRIMRRLQEVANNFKIPAQNNFIRKFATLQVPIFEHALVSTVCWCGVRGFRGSPLYFWHSYL